MSALSLIWPALPIFEVFKQHRIGSAAAALALILAYAAHRQPHRKRTLKVIAQIFSVLVTTGYLVVVPI